MNLEGKSIGFALTGSFCTYKSVFVQMERLVDCKANVYPIFSNAAQSFNTRFGKAEDFLQQANELTGHKPITTIPEAEPIGPKGYLDALIIAPCTGNTTAKLANAITDTPVLMAAKAHLRNEKPLILALSTNDALAMNMKNVGLLLNCKNIYVVPFGQDNYKKKTNSLVAHMDLIIPTLEYALDGIQIQPILKDYPEPE